MTFIISIFQFFFKKQKNLLVFDKIYFRLGLVETNNDEEKRSPFTNGKHMQDDNYATSPPRKKLALTNNTPENEHLTEIVFPIKVETETLGNSNPLFGSDSDLLKPESESCMITSEESALDVDLQNESPGNLFGC